ncbi:hypothetical protein DIPPA_07989 [Diplonema papillatum]|nr:hypothetical protein DIPPA_07989 [Diplonema papillatum]
MKRDSGEDDPLSGSSDEEANRDAVTNWKCSDCGFVNQAKYQNKECHSCSKPRPSDAVLIFLARKARKARKATDARKKRRTYLGGQEEMELREDVRQELATARKFEEKWRGHAAVLDEKAAMLANREKALEHMLEVEADLASKHDELITKKDGRLDEDFVTLVSEALAAAKGFP